MADLSLRPAELEPDARLYQHSDPGLRLALARAAAVARRSDSPWRQRVVHVLNRRRFRLARLPAGVHGLNPLGPFWPLVLIDETFAARADETALTRLLLHEALHQCFVVWPEWKLWFNWLASRLLPRRKWRDPYYPLFAYNTIYGAAVNSADRIVEQLLQRRV